MRHALSMLLILLAATMFFAGCAHKITPESIEQQVILGKTTKQEVLNQLGAPYMKHKLPGVSIRVPGKKAEVLHRGGEAWYYYIHYLGVIDIMAQETLRILFDDKGIVSTYTFTKNALSTDSPE